MKAYISVSFSKKKLVDREITAIVDTLNGFKIASFVFVDQYTFSSEDERYMMKQAMIDIDNCDILLAETPNKGIGIEIEVGYAKAREKTIYLRQVDAEHSTTVSGISDFKIVYFDVNNLRGKLYKFLSKWEKFI